ncbi:MAG TPA: anti-sigma factor [Puia sp.]|nr:anti-sigma factor [Puia sp.]
MNVQEYISGGIIESYVMGLATESERLEFEQKCAQYPEVAAAFREFEEKWEKFALQNAVPAPEMVKVRFLEAIRNTASGNTPSFNQPKIITMENEKEPVRRTGGSRFLAAASVILLIGLAWFAFQYNSLKSTNADLSKTNNSLKTTLNSKDSILNQILAEDAVTKDAVSNPNVTVVNMVGTGSAPKSSANVYWDSTSSNVFLVVKNMPALPTDQQYQLWALIDGKPSDLGVFDATNEKVILKMKNTKKAQAFAITIERKGGSPSPTLQKMQSLGKTTIKQ